MNLLLHICCGPCTTYPLTQLREEGLEPGGFFYNPNIHPYREFRRRLEALDKLILEEKFQVHINRDYGLRDFLRQVVYKEDSRCELCYRMRLIATAEHAVEMKADAFSTTLLYSRYQKHGLIRKIGESIAQQYGLHFLYRDFRQGWQEGIDMAIEKGLYRQPYCGCIYSEEERYNK